MKVDVYRNLNRECISVRSRETESYGTVVDHVEEIVVRDIEFVVQPAGRESVRDENRKNVHAFVRGVRVDEEEFDTEEDTAVDVTYNPYKYDSFVVRESEEPIHEASMAKVTPTGVVAIA